MDAIEIEVTYPSEEWPDGFQLLAELVRVMGTEWVRDALEEIEDEFVED